MPKNKDLKRLTRRRMEKTGESYTSARQQLLARKGRADSPLSDEDLAARAGMSNEAVAARTGRRWREWLELIDGMEGRTVPHRDLVARIHRELELPAWWSQTVVVGYERIRGLREIGQRRGGSYEVSKSRTIAVPVEILYAAFEEDDLRRRWLAVDRWEVRKATANKSIRLTWEDDTSVVVQFNAKSESKSQVTVQHMKLDSRDRAEALRQYWGAHLTNLAEMLLG